jgi:hypothetical protein
MLTAGGSEAREASANDGDTRTSSHLAEKLAAGRKRDVPSDEVDEDATLLALLV